MKLNILVPYLTVKNAEKSIDFYHNAFGFNVQNIGRNEAGLINHVEMKCDEVRLMFSPEGACDDPSQSPLTTNSNCPIGIYAYCDNVDEIYEKALQAGAKSRSMPKNRYWAERMCEVEDIDGYQWYFTCPL